MVVLLCKEKRQLRNVREEVRHSLEDGDLSVVLCLWLCLGDLCGRDGQDACGSAAPSRSEPALALFHLPWSLPLFPFFLGQPLPSVKLLLNNFAKRDSGSERVLLLQTRGLGDRWLKQWVYYRA